MDDFELEIKRTFLEEATQLLEEAEAIFLLLDAGNTDIENIEKLFRVAHNFKGSAKAVGFDELSAFAHKVEDVLTKIKNGSLAVEKNVTGVLFQAIDIMKALVNGLRMDFGFTFDTSDCVASLESLQNGGATEPASRAASVEQLQAVATAPAAAAPVASTPKKPTSNAPTSTSTEEESIRVSTKRLDQLLNLVGELVVNQSIMTQHRAAGTTASSQAVQILSYMEKLVKEVQDISMSLRLLPVKPLFQKMRRTIRDVSDQTKKDVEFVTEGEHVELDKTILERITDPLTHMVRNAVDHGIENSEERKGSGKPLKAIVRLEAIQQEDRVLIKISDDGKGLNKEVLLRKGIEKGLVRPDEQLSDAEIYGLIFKPGFSTKDQVSDISGRGVGMDVVSRAVDDLKGSIQIETALGKGTDFIISLPLSLSIVPGMVVRVQDRKFVVPISQLVETIQYQKLKIEQVQGKGKMVNLRGEVIPIFSLSKALAGKGHKPAAPSGATTNHSQHQSSSGLVISFKGKKVSFEIDDIIGQQQIVLKKLGTEMRQLPGIIGGAILSDGEPGLVLNLHDFVEQGGAYAA